MSFYDRLDHVHRKFDTLQPQSLVEGVWEQKYRRPGEGRFGSTFTRVVNHVYTYDLKSERDKALAVMEARLFSPAGCVLANAGVGENATLMNCFVNDTLEDDLPAIMRVLEETAITLRARGGVGTNFSPIRPEGAFVRSAPLAAGPLKFMEMFNTMSKALARRGQMATLIDTHPDLPKYIEAKHEKGKLESFNMSILVSDALMAAVWDDEEWLLHFHIPPAAERSSDLIQRDFRDDNGVKQYVYSVWKARDLWDKILRSTYDYAEPGIIFIDRINDLNNLRLLEWLWATNPCGEQPLPANGACDLGTLWLARFVRNPFQEGKASFDFDLFREVIRIAVRFLDNVIDASQYPHPKQKQEQIDKRRIGLNGTGLADALAMLGLRYGSANAIKMTEQIYECIALTAYEASMDLALERGPFGLYDAKKYPAPGSFADNLPEPLKQKMRENGIRNSVLLTSAPTGSLSIWPFCNTSSAFEPNFYHKMNRKVKSEDTKETVVKEYTSYSYIHQMYGLVHGLSGDYELPPYIVTVDDLTVADHVLTQAAVQRWTDASVSKTVNVPVEMSFEEFKGVYQLAYSTGCKGCTTYRPNPIRGSIIEDASKPKQVTGPQDESGETVFKLAWADQKPVLLMRDDVLRGVTHKIKWPSWKSALYMTVNYTQDHIPFEVFFNSKDAIHQEWMTALSLMISAILRKGGDVTFIGDELSSVHSINDTAWIKHPSQDRPKFFGSLIAYIGFLLGEDLKIQPSIQEVIQAEPAPKLQRAERCPKCLAPTFEHKEGCKTCSNCGYSECY